MIKLFENTGKIVKPSQGLRQKAFDTYFGGKEAEGTKQTIINQIPPCELFVELCGGNYAISRTLNSEAQKWINDIEPSVFEAYRSTIHFIDKNYRFTQKDATQVIAEIDRFSSQVFNSIVIYFDPPYRKESCLRNRDIYAQEMPDSSHTRILNKLIALVKKHKHIKVMVSHYPDALYESKLAKWRKLEYMNTTRQGQKKELLFFSYDIPQSLLDYRFIGSNYTQRQQYKRLVDRNIAKIKRLDPLLRKRLLREINQTNFDMENQLYPLAEALELANKCSTLLFPHIEVGYIGGSIRRSRPMVRDIELIVLPKSSKNVDLFGDKVGQTRSLGFIEAASSLGRVVKGSIETGKYVKIELPEGISLDLFMPSAHDYYRQLVIRTGGSKWVIKYVATKWKRLGWIGTPDGLRRIEECKLDELGQFVSVLLSNPTLPPHWKSEQEFFEFLGLDYDHFQNPKMREV